MMPVSIKWCSSTTRSHEAVFVKSSVGVRVVVDTFEEKSEDPCRTETGALGPMLKTLLDPAGRYRLGALIGQTLEEKIEELIDSDPVPEWEPNIHPIFAPILASIAPRGSVHARASGVAA